MVFNHLCVLFELKKLIRLEQKNHVYSIQTSIALGIIISACSMLSCSPKGLKIVNGMQIVYRLNRFRDLPLNHNTIEKQLTWISFTEYFDISK